MKIQKAEKLKSGAYMIRLRLGGKTIYVHGTTEAECRRNATTVKAEHLSGKVVAKSCPLTTEEAIDKYIAEHPKLSPSTVRGYESIRDNVFRSAKTVRIDAVKWQSVIDKDTHSPKTIKNAWGLIKSVMQYCGLQAPQVNLPMQIKTERQFLDQEQIERFVATLRGENCEIAALLGLHSLRRSEILDLTWNDIDIKRGIIHVRGAAVIDKDNNIVHKKENKNASSTRDVPIMIPRLKELLSQGGEGYIVTYHPNTLYGVINTVCRKAGVPEVGVHGLRHSFVSLAYHLGWSELATMRVAGYADYQTMRKIYTHISEADKQEDIENMMAFFTKSNLAVKRQRSQKV